MTRKLTCYFYELKLKIFSYRIRFLGDILHLERSKKYQEKQSYDDHHIKTDMMTATVASSYFNMI